MLLWRVGDRVRVLRPNAESTLNLLVTMGRFSLRFSLRGLPARIPCLFQVLQQKNGGFLRRRVRGIQSQFRMQRLFIRVVDPREVLQVSYSRLDPEREHDRPCRGFLRPRCETLHAEADANLDQGPLDRRQRLPPAPPEGPHAGAAGG